MPPKSKRQKQLLKCLEKGREVKRSRRDSSSQVEASEAGEEPYGTVSDIEDLMGLSQEALNTDSESVDPSFSLDTSVKSDEEFLVESFCENWVLQLGRDDKVSLGLFLAFQLSEHFDCGEARAAELAGLMIGSCA